MPRPARSGDLATKNLLIKMTRPNYRFMLYLSEVSGLSLQAQARQALADWLDKERARLERHGVPIPHPYAMSMWSEDEFARFLMSNAEEMRTMLAEKGPPKRSGLVRRPATAATAA